MNKDPKQILLDILDVIGYEDDRNKFVADFLSLCYQQALVDLMADLPQDAQSGLVQKLANLVDYDNLKGILSEYFPNQKYEQAVKKASETVFIEYIQTIVPSLTPEQKEKLDNYLSETAKQTA